LIKQKGFPYINNLSIARENKPRYSFTINGSMAIIDSN